MNHDGDVDHNKALEMYQKCVMDVCKAQYVTANECAETNGKISLQKMFPHVFLISPKPHNNTLFENVRMIMVMVMVILCLSFLFYQALESFQIIFINFLSFKVVENRLW